MEAKHLKPKLKEDNHGFIEAIPGIVFAVIISYVYLNIGTYMNGTIGSELSDSIDGSTSIERAATKTMDNLSSYFDSNLGIIKIAITISVLLVPLMAIMTMRRIV